MMGRDYIKEIQRDQEMANKYLRANVFLGVLKGSAIPMKQKKELRDLAVSGRLGEAWDGYYSIVRRDERE